jgi:hypothetical protein
MIYTGCLSIVTAMRRVGHAAARMGEDTMHRQF